MNSLPEKFPELIIMYKTLTKKINQLNEEKQKAQNTEIKTIQDKIKNTNQRLPESKTCFLKNFLNYI